MSFFSSSDYRYPFMQRPLEKSEEEVDPLKPHLQELCEKCRALGYNCRDKRYRFQGKRFH